MLDQKLADWLKEDIKDLNDRVKNLDEKMDANFEAIQDDVRQLLAFKWQIIGGSVAISSIAAILINVLLAFKP